MTGEAMEDERLKPVRYSIKELLHDIEANAEGLGAIGGRLLDQHEINVLFKNGNSDLIQDVLR
jgi:hypothetical protein